MFSATIFISSHSIILTSDDLDGISTHWSPARQPMLVPDAKFQVPHVY